MSTRQVGLVVLVALIGLVARQNQALRAGPGQPKCNSNCWNMVSTDTVAQWQIPQESGELGSICYSYYSGEGAINIHAPFDTMRTTQAVGGTRQQQTGTIQEYKTMQNCDRTCNGLAPIEATPKAGDSFKANANPSRYQCK